MRTLILAATVLGLSVGGAFAQANPNAPQPNSSGTGVTQPGTTSTGQAVDRGTTGSAVSPRPMGTENGNSANSMRGPNAAGAGSMNGAEGRTSGGGAGGSGAGK